MLHHPHPYLSAPPRLRDPIWQFALIILIGAAVLTAVNPTAAATFVVAIGAVRHLVAEVFSPRS